MNQNWDNFEMFKKHLKFMAYWNLIYNPDFYLMIVSGNLQWATTASFVDNVVTSGLDSDYANRAIITNNNVDDHSRTYVFDNSCKLNTDDPWS